MLYPVFCASSSRHYNWPGVAIERVISQSLCGFLISPTSFPVPQEVQGRTRMRIERYLCWPPNLGGYQTNSVIKINNVLTK